MASLGQLVVNLEANIARFTSDMGRASQTVEQTMGRMNAAADVVKGVLGAVGLALSVDALVGEANRAIGALADLDDMAQKTGASVETLSKLGQVAAMTGTDFGTVDAAITKLAKNMTTADEKGSKFAKAMDAIGVSTDGIERRDPAELFVEIANKLQNYEDGAGKAALMTDAISKSAADLLPYMNDVSENIDQFTGSTAEAAAAASKYQDDLGRMKVKYDQLVTSIVTAALPAATDFIGALSDTTREANLLTGTSVDSWADDIAVGLARVVDVARLIPRMFGAVSGSFKAVAADIEFMGVVAENANPLKAAYKLAQGGDPSGEIRAALEKRNAVVQAANQGLSELWNAPANQMEQEMLKRLAARAGAVPSVNAPAAPRTELAYSSGGDGSGKEKKAEEEWSGAAAAARMVELANDETLALRNTIDVTNDLIEADARRFEQKMRAAEQITAGAENIRLSLMSDAEAEQFEFDSRIAQLQAFSTLKLENEMTANALIEAETLRHVQAKADMERMHQLQVLGMAGNSADQLYSLLEQAGLEQTALGKALFVANKAIAVAEIIMNTELAAAKALAMGPIVGPPLAMAVRVMGYASAGIVIGTTIASAEGGYDIPAGTNPVTQLHEKEMVLPKAQAEVIRGLAARGGAGGGGVIINNSPVFNIDSRTDQQEVRKIVSMGVAQGNADLVDRLSRAGRI